MTIKINAAHRLTAAVTAKTVEKAIKQRFGYDVKLHRGAGYYYFADPDDMPMRVSKWDSSSVYTYRLNDLDLAQWLDAFEGMMNDNKDRE